MRRHRMTPLKLFLALFGLMGVMIVASLASFVISGGSLNPAENRAPEHFVLQSGADVEGRSAEELQQLFDEPAPVFNWENLELQPVDMSTSKLIDLFIQANEDIKGYEINAISRIVSTSGPPGREIVNQPRYQTLRFFAYEDVYARFRLVRYEQYPSRLWIAEIIENGAERVDISPLMKREGDQMVVQRNLKFADDHSTIDGFRPVSIFTFGRGVPPLNMNRVETMQSVKYPHLIRVTFIDPTDSKWNSSYNLAGHYNVVARAQQSSVLHIWLDLNKGGIWRRVSFLSENQSIISRSGSGTDVYETLIEARDNKEIDGVWIPHLITVSRSYSENREDYRIISAERVDAPASYLNRINGMRTPQPGDAVIDWRTNSPAVPISE